MITQKELKSLLDYDSSSGFFVWKVDRGKARKGMIAGTHDTNGYIQIKINGTTYLAHRLAWLYVYGYLPENIIDHENRVKDENKIKNLRETSQLCNLQNSSIRKDNNSGVKGVHFNNKRRKWIASIRVNYKRFHLGIYEDFTEAVCHRLAAEQAENWFGCDSSSSAFLYVTNFVHRHADLSGRFNFLYGDLCG